MFFWHIVFLYNFVSELTWTDLYCLQPQEKMLKLKITTFLAVRHNSICVDSLLL